MILLIIPIIGVYFLPIKNKNTKFVLLAAFLLSFTIVRYGVGADYFSYSYIYELVNVDLIYDAFSVQLRYEPLIKGVFYLFNNIGLDYKLGLNLFSSLILIGFIVWIYRNSINPLISMILFGTMFYFVWVLSALRQVIPILIGLYLLYDRRKYSLQTKIIWIFAGGLFHSSSYFLLIIVLFNVFKFTKKQMLELVGASIFISFLPLYQIITVMKFLPFQDKLLYYVDPGFGFTSFGYIIRIGFTIFFILMYDKISFKNKYLLDNLLFGFITYFVFSFSSIVAGRLAIFSYIPIVLLIPEIINLIDNRKLAITTTMMFSILYYMKETIALIDQSGMSSVWSIPLIFNADNHKFDKYDYFLLDKKNYSSELLNNFNDSVKDMKYVGYDENQYNFIAWNNDEHGYLIYDTNGNLSIDYPMRGNPSLYKDVLVNYYDVGGLFMEERFIDLSGKKRTKDEMIEYISNYEALNRLAMTEEELTGYKFNELPEVTKSLFLFQDRVTEVKVYRISSSFEYYILEAKYYYDKVYVMLDTELLPLNDLLFNSISTFDLTNTAEARYHGKRIHLNSNGKIIWIGG